MNKISTLLDSVKQQIAFVYAPQTPVMIELAEAARLASLADEPPTTDQQAAGSVDTLTAAIMNLRCAPVCNESHNEQVAYRKGHRDARHAAIELVNEHAAALDSRAQPVADDIAAKALHWFACLDKCARLLDLPADEPIPSGVVAAVEKLTSAQPVACYGASKPSHECPCAECVACRAQPVAAGELPPLDIGGMVNRFLGWPLPNSLSARLAPNVKQPIGTHLMNADEAKAMFEHCTRDQLRPTDDDLWDQTLRERDLYHEWADKLADAVAKHFGVDIGEHSNQNCPWAEALEAIEGADSRPAGGVTESGIVITLRQAEALVAFFGGHDCEVSVRENPWPGALPGLYAYCTEYPTAGADYLGPTDVDDDLAIHGSQPAATLAASAAPVHPLADEHGAWGLYAESVLERSASAAQPAPQLTVWEGAMPESNGKSNFTALLMRKGADIFDHHFTIARSEYPERVRYGADCVRHIIGELPEWPCIIDYDADKHSGYVPASPTTNEKG